MIIRYDTLDQKLRDLPVDIDQEFHEQCLLSLRGGDRRPHGLLLYGLVKALQPACVVDVGTARGYSAVIMAKALEDAGIEGKVYTIDTIDNKMLLDWHSPKWGGTDPAAGKRLSRWDLLEPFKELVDRRIIFLTGRSAQMIPRIKEPVDLAFLDASPHYHDVRLDARLLLEHSRHSLWLVVDGFDPTDEFELVPNWLNRILLTFDQGVPRAGYEGLVYKRCRCPGVTKAIFELTKLAQSVEIVPIEDSTALWKRHDYGIAILAFQQLGQPATAERTWRSPQ